jgi:asparagine synthase (glutamine-hydrolysing)
VLLGDSARARGQMRPRVVARLLDEHAAGRADHAHRLWCLLMLELWQQHHIDTASDAAAAA